MRKLFKSAAAVGSAAVVFATALLTGEVVTFFWTGSTSTFADPLANAALFGSAAILGLAAGGTVLSSSLPQRKRRHCPA